jgi:hypothetical protein
MRIQHTIVTAITASIVTIFIAQAKAQNPAVGKDGIAASPKVRQALEERERSTMVMTPITSPADVAGLKDGDMIAMACPKCKTITVTRINTEKGHIQTTTTGLEHLCPGCEQKFVVVGQGKGKHDVVKHVCKKCGSTDAFCCVEKKDGAPTSGMEDMGKNKQ